MSVEQVTYINDLEPARPQGGDSIAQGDDHIRNIKKAIKQTFPNIAGEVLVSDEELNDVMNAINTIKDEYEASFDDQGNVKAKGVVNTEDNAGVVITATSVYPIDGDSGYKTNMDLGETDKKWNDLYVQNINTDTLYTSSLVFFGRSMWASDGAGLYFGGDENIYPGNTQAGKTDGVSNLGNNNSRYKNAFLSGNVLGRSAMSGEQGVALTVTDVIESFEAIRESAARATTMEGLRSSIVDTIGDLISQMRDKQEELIAELHAEGDEE